MANETGMETTVPLEPLEPLQAFRFLIKIGDGEQVEAAFARCSGIRMQVETLQFRSGDDNRGVKEYTPVFTGHAPITFTKGVVGDYEFWNWILEASANASSGPRGNNLRRTIHICGLDKYGNTKVDWTLSQAMPIGYELSELDGSRSEVLMESVTFAFTGLKRSSFSPEIPAKKAPRKKVSPSPKPRKEIKPRQKPNPSPIPKANQGKE